MQDQDLLVQIITTSDLNTILPMDMCTRVRVFESRESQHGKQYRLTMQLVDHVLVHQKSLDSFAALSQSRDMRRFVNQYRSQIKDDKILVQLLWVKTIHRLHTFLDDSGSISTSRSMIKRTFLPILMTQDDMPIPRVETGVKRSRPVESIDLAQVDAIEGEAQGDAIPVQQSLVAHVPVCRFPSKRMIMDTQFTDDVDTDLATEVGDSFASIVPLSHPFDGRLLMSPRVVETVQETVPTLLDWANQMDQGPCPEFFSLISTVDAASKELDKLERERAELQQKMRELDAKMVEANQTIEENLLSVKSEFMSWKKLATTDEAETLLKTTEYCGSTLTLPEDQTMLLVQYDYEANVCQIVDLPFCFQGGVWKRQFKHKIFADNHEAYDRIVSPRLIASSQFASPRLSEAESKRGQCALVPRLCDVMWKRETLHSTDACLNVEIEVAKKDYVHVFVPQAFFDSLVTDEERLIEGQTLCMSRLARSIKVALDLSCPSLGEHQEADTWHLFALGSTHSLIACWHASHLIIRIKDNVVVAFECQSRD